MRLNLSSAKWRPFCLGLTVLRRSGLSNMADNLHAFSCKKVFGILVQISVEIFRQRPVCCKLAMAEVEDWCHTGDELLLAPNLPKFHDVKNRHWFSVGSSQINCDELHPGFWVLTTCHIISTPVIILTVTSWPWNMMSWVSSGYKECPKCILTKSRNTITDSII